MRLNIVAALALGAVLFAAPQAFAFGSGGHKSGFTTVDGMRVAYSCSNGTCTYRQVAASEPLTAFALGLGLLGARYLRRRQ
jgi:hypothetical protein